MSTIIPFALELHHTAGTVAQAEAREHAADIDALGVDHCPGDDAPFADVLAHLAMFDPIWLFGQSWMVGWVVTPTD